MKGIYMLKLYSIFDKKAASFEKPFMVKHEAEALRSVQIAFEAPENQRPWFVRYPGDYALYYLGSFDPATGQIMPPAELAPQFALEVASLAPLTKEGGLA